MNDTKLFVGNLDYSVTDAELDEHFRQAGDVVSTKVISDKYSGRSRGFGFVEYGSAEEAQKAIDMFHGKEFKGRNLVVNIARPKEDRPQGGGRRGDFHRDRRDH
jgi:RNA recognition motif-containing protein